MQTTDNYVSVLFGSLLQPIVDLFDLMEQKGPTGPNDVQAPRDENGYSVSIAVLVALVIESACNRVRYVLGDADRKSAVQTLTDLSAGEMADDVEELFVLRDASHTIIFGRRLLRATTRRAWPSSPQHCALAMATTSLTGPLTYRHVKLGACN